MNIGYRKCDRVLYAPNGANGRECPLGFDSGYGKNSDRQVKSALIELRRSLSFAEDLGST